MIHKLGMGISCLIFFLLIAGVQICLGQQKGHFIDRPGPHSLSPSPLLLARRGGAEDNHHRHDGQGLEHRLNDDRARHGDRPGEGLEHHDETSHPHGDEEMAPVDSSGSQPSDQENSADDDTSELRPMIDENPQDIQSEGQKKFQFKPFLWRKDPESVQ